MFFTSMTFSSCNVLNVNSVECVSMNNQECSLCKCSLDTSVCNNKQRWDEDKCRCKCKELIDKGMCDKGFIWNPNNCECYRLCGLGEYLDYKNCKCRKKLTDKSVEECSENIDGNKMLYNETLDVISMNAIPLNVYKKVCGSCTIPLNM